MYLVFDSYELTSSYFTTGICVTASVNETLTRPFSFLSPSELSSDFAQADARASFVEPIGFATCQAGDQPKSIQVLNPSNITFGSILSSIPVADVTSSSLKKSTSQSSALLSRAASSSLKVPTSQNNPSNRPISKTGSSTRILIAVSVAVGFLIILVLAILLLRRYRKKRTATITDARNSANSLDDIQPYLQQKAELEAEEQRRNELEARERSNEVHELAAERERRRVSLLQELRGLEHSQELAVQDNPIRGRT